MLLQVVRVWLHAHLQLLPLLLLLCAVTPPGHFTANGVTDKCDITQGQFRAEWKPASDLLAQSCSECGANILSAETEEITQYSIVTEAPSKVNVTATSAACCEYPALGWGHSA